MTPGHHARFDSVPDADDAALDIAVRDDDPYTEVAVAGEIDFGSHRALLDTLSQKIDNGRPRIVLDRLIPSFATVRDAGTSATD